MKKYLLRNGLRDLWVLLPEHKQRYIVSFLENNQWIPGKDSIVSILSNRIGYKEVREYADYLNRNFDKEVKRIQEKPSFVKVNIRRNGGFFHANIITEVIEYTVAAMMKGTIPIFFVNDHINEKENLCLEWLFVQPAHSVFGMTIEGYDSIEYSTIGVDNLAYRIEFKYLWDYNNEEWKTWKELAARIIQKNDFFREYVSNDKLRNGINSSELLGVIIRGTDYTKLRPKLHPVQPDVEEIIAELKDQFYTSNYSGIYVATDEERVYRRIIEEFGAEIVFSNSREYYDEIYRENNLWQITEARKSRENDLFYNSLEYISSMFILSECRGIVGGACSGGSLAALFGNHEYIYFFNKGWY